MLLLGEGTEAWRPVSARALGGNEFEVLGIVPPDENWQFPPGHRVRCKEKVFSAGTVGLVAYEEIAA